MPDMAPQERNHRDAALVGVYRRKGIPYDNQALFEADGFTHRPMPTRKDLLEMLSENPDAKNLALVGKPVCHRLRQAAGIGPPCEPG